MKLPDKNLPERVFIDSNIFIYSIDDGHPRKKQIARALLKDLLKNYTPIISSQVIQEFYSIVTSKLKVSQVDARRIVENFNHFEICNLDFDLIKAGIELSIFSKTSFWDGLILATASHRNCARLYTEDLNNGQIIKGVAIVNPFS